MKFIKSKEGNVTFLKPAPAYWEVYTRGMSYDEVLRERRYFEAELGAIEKTIKAFSDFDQRGCIIETIDISKQFAEFKKGCGFMIGVCEKKLIAMTKEKQA